MELQPQVPVVIEPPHRLPSLEMRSLWRYRELLYFLVWRDTKVRYKQTIMGVAWIILQPLLSMLIFTLLFGSLLKVDSGGVPYPIFVYSALLPWQYFAGSLTRSTTSVVSNVNLITRVYFPRLLIPTSGVISALVDFSVAFLVLIGLMIFYQVTPTTNILYLPLFILLAMCTSLGFGLWFSALNVRYRDINQMISFVVQIWMYITPVIYGPKLIPERFRFLLGLNPMTGVVEGFRWALLGQRWAESHPPEGLFFISIGISLFVLLSGLWFFRKTESSFADVI